MSTEVTLGYQTEYGNWGDGALNVSVKVGLGVVEDGFQAARNLLALGIKQVQEMSHEYQQEVAEREGKQRQYWDVDRRLRLATDRLNNVVAALEANGVDCSDLKELQQEAVDFDDIPF